ncbi:MAG: zinc-ribbon domain-containing protein [Pirellulales bacterium]|nr:zinc-ribbon domain-containing protein [Pirellulales bacterium]
MTSDSPWFDQPGDELDDDEYPDPPDDEDETPTASCPECGADVYEDAVQCPACGAYITPTSGSHLWAGRPVWWIVLGVLGIAATIVVLAMF